MQKTKKFQREMLVLRPGAYIINDQFLPVIAALTVSSPEQTRVKYRYFKVGHWFQEGLQAAKAAALDYQQVVNETRQYDLVKRFNQIRRHLEALGYCLTDADTLTKQKH